MSSRQTAMQLFSKSHSENVRLLSKMVNLHYFIVNYKLISKEHVKHWFKWCHVDLDHIVKLMASNKDAQTIEKEKCNFHFGN